MSVTQAIMRNKTLLKFRVMMPAEITSKGSQYPYQQTLTDYAAYYIKKHHRGATNPAKAKIQYNVIYDGCPWLELVIPIFNHRNEETIIEVEY